MKLSYSLLAIAAITGSASIAAEKQPVATAPAKIPKLNPGVPAVSTDRYVKYVEPKPEEVADGTPLATFIKVMELAKRDNGTGKELTEIYKHFSPVLKKAHENWLKGMPLIKMPYFAKLISSDSTVPFTYIVLVNDGDTVILMIKYRSLEKGADVNVFTENFKKLMANGYSAKTQSNLMNTKMKTWQRRNQLIAKTNPSKNNLLQARALKSGGLIL